MAFISLQQLNKRFKYKRVISNLSLDVNMGDLFGLVGKSGCGKTTLLKILIGMINPDSGKILFDNKNVFFNKNFLRRNVGFASQENMLYEELTLKENIYYFGKLYGVKGKIITGRMYRLLGLFELDSSENELISKLSGGMKKRANILVSLIHDPKLLILDEPTVGLDFILREKIWYYIRLINASGKTIIVTSHLLEELEENCKTLGIMKNGKITNIIRDKRMFQIKHLKEIFEEEMKNG